jgi:heptosyltransferase-2
VLKRSLSSAIMALFSGAPERIGFATEGRGLLLSKRVPYRQDRHEVENFLAVLRADGIEVTDTFLECWTTPEEDVAAAGLIAGAGVPAGERLVAIHPFAANPQRGWCLEDFASLAALFSKQGFTPLLLGAPGDRSDFDAAQALFGAGVVDLVGKCSLRVTMALLKRCSLFVGNDSGIMHLAAAAGIPLVALFGPQSPVKFGPWSEQSAVIYKKFACSPCRQKFFTECEPSPRQRPACVEAIMVDEVFAKGIALLHAYPRRA